MSSIKAGDIVRIPMGPLTVKFEVTEVDPDQRTGSMQFVSAYESSWRPKYPRGHKARNNGMMTCADCNEDLEVYVIDHRAHLRHKPRRPPAPSPKPIHDNDRTHCSSCGRRFEAYELKPGDGRCVECAP